MKTTILLSFAYILFVFSANAATDDPVLDTRGKLLRAGVEYYAIPAARDGESGGIFLTKVNNFTCPAGIAQHQLDDIYGNKQTFIPVNPRKGVITLSTDVNIKFSGSRICHQSNVWKLEYDKSVKGYAVMMGGVLGNPGPETLDNWFKIEKTEDGYKFVYCPSVCSTCKVMCKDIGSDVDDYGVGRLMISNKPLSVLFQKVIYDHA